jgi:hypothetical protein
MWRSGIAVWWSALSGFWYTASLLRDKSHDFRPKTQIGNVAKDLPPQLPCAIDQQQRVSRHRLRDRPTVIRRRIHANWETDAVFVHVRTQGCNGHCMVVFEHCMQAHHDHTLRAEQLMNRLHLRNGVRDTAGAQHLEGAGDHDWPRCASRPMDADVFRHSEVRQGGAMTG